MNFYCCLRKINLSVMDPFKTISGVLAIVIAHANDLKRAFNGSQMN